MPIAFRDLELILFYLYFWRYEFDCSVFKKRWKYLNTDFFKVEYEFTIYYKFYFHATLICPGKVYEEILKCLPGFPE
jgi:hypothetical protein